MGPLEHAINPIADPRFDRNRVHQQQAGSRGIDDIETGKLGVQDWTKLEWERGPPIKPPFGGAVRTWSHHASPWGCGSENSNRSDRATHVKV